MRAVCHFAVTALIVLGNNASAQPESAKLLPDKSAAAARESLERFEHRQADSVAKLPDHPKLTGSFAPGPSGRRHFLTDAGVSLPLANPDDFLSVPTGFPGILSATKENTKVRGMEWSPSLLVSWEKDSKRAFPVGEFRGLHDAFNRLADVSARVNNHGAMGPAQSTKELAEASKQVADETLKAYPRAKELLPMADVEKLCIQHEEARREYRKAIYGRNDNYRPEVYERIFKNSQSAVAIAANTDPKGSGVLIGDNLILTCKHCVDDYTPKELKVWFDFDVGNGFAPKDQYPVEKILVRGVPPANAFDPLDFALLEIGSNIKGEQAAKKYEPATLSTTRQKRDDPVYVVGYPQQRPRTVHDNAFVLFPFQATEEQYNDLAMFVCAETKLSPRRSEELRDFLSSYVLNQPLSLYENYNVVWKCPAMLADCDTYHGDSGAGVFSRGRSEVVGLLKGGAPDNGVANVPGWQTHEVVVPIGPILHQLDAWRPGWKKEFHVKEGEP